MLLRGTVECSIMFHLFLVFSGMRRGSIQWTDGQVEALCLLLGGASFPGHLPRSTTHADFDLRRWVWTRLGSGHGGGRLPL